MRPVSSPPRRVVAVPVQSRRARCRARGPARYRWALAGVVLVVVAFASTAPRDRTPRPREGAVYVRAGVDGALVAPVLADTASGTSPLAGRLVRDLLVRDLRIRIDHVGPCADLVDKYVRHNAGLAGTIGDPLERAFRTVRPVRLAGPLIPECFSYAVTYDVPLRQPMRWKNRLLAQVPVRLALIHPLEDFRHFQKDEPDD